MAPSQSPETGKWSLALQAFLRSAHALIFSLSLLTLVLFFLAAAEYPIVAYLASGLFALCVIVVLLRYAVKGPEQDRAQPSLTYSPQQLQIVNMDPAAMESLANMMVHGRQPLPPAAGILVGPASDPSSLRELTVEEARLLHDATGLPPEAEEAGSTTSNGDENHRSNAGPADSLSP
jgi:hypothetical protein